MNHPLRGVAAIVGAADTEVGKLPDRTPMQLTAEAILRALDDAGLERCDVDGLITCNSMAEPYMYHAEATAEYLQMFPRYCLTAGAGGGTTFTVIEHAISAIATGIARTIVIAMADCLRTGMSRERAMVTQSSAGHPQFETPYGPTVPALYALIARAHMHRFGTSVEDFAHIAVTCREHASLNPLAEKRERITVGDVLDSRLIADPLRLLDCSLVSDGGAAVVLTHAERARDFPHPAVFVLGVGEGYGHEHISAARDLTESAARVAGERAYAMAGCGPGDVDFIELYDCFTPVVLLELEDLGFCAKGEGGALARSGSLRLGGALPMNTHGGLLSHAHPGNPGSMFALSEAVRQLRGSCGPRQVHGAEVGLLHAQGGILSSHCTLILGNEATR